MKYNVPVIIEKDADGYFAYAPDLQGCYTQGDTYEEALANVREVVALHIEVRLASGEEIPTDNNISLTTVEVEVDAETTAVES